MHVLFVYPDILRYQAWRGVYYHGIGYLSAVLKAAGYTTSLIHVIDPSERKDFVSRALNEQPDLVAFSATTNQFLYVREWVRWIKEAKSELLTICGGVHSTLNPKEAIDAEGLDIICRGEGEKPLLELVQRIEKGENFDNIQNMWIKRANGQVVRNPLRPIIQHLDTLPFADREIFDFPTLCISEGGATFMASRGCPYSCSYCCNHALHQLYQIPMKQYVRFRSVKNVIEEISQVLGRYPFIKSIHFDDDILPLRPKWFQEFAQQYAVQIGVPFSCNMRPNLMDKEVTGLLKAAGCFRVQLGIECGNERIINSVLNRNLTRKQIAYAFELCREAGLKTKAYNMIGLPLEDMNCILDTIELNAECEPSEIQVSIFYPYRGTSIYNLCKDRGLLTDNEAPDYLRESVLDLKDLTHGELRFAEQFFNYLSRAFQLLYKAPSHLSKVLRTFLRSLVQNNTIQSAMIKGYQLVLPAARRVRSLYRARA